MCSSINLNELSEEAGQPLEQVHVLFWYVRVSGKEKGS